MLRWNIASLHVIMPPHILCLKRSSDIVWDNGGLQVVASHILSCFILSWRMLQTKAYRGFQLSSQFKNYHKSFQIMLDFRMTRWARRSARPVTQPPASHLFRAHLKIALHAQHPNWQLNLVLMTQLVWHIVAAYARSSRSRGR